MSENLATIDTERLAELIEELCAGLGKPYGIKNKAILAAYARTVGKQPEPAVEWAVGEAIRRGGKRPEPAELLRLCLKSGHGVAPPPRATVATDVHRCSECLEWAGWHRIASLFQRQPPPVLRVEYRVRHASSCAAAAWEAREFRSYSWTWVDTMPPRGRLAFGERAWELEGVEPVMPVPEPARPAPRTRPTSRTPNPYRPDRILAPIAAAVPGAQKLITAGEAPTEEEELR